MLLLRDQNLDNKRFESVLGIPDSLNTFDLGCPLQSSWHFGRVDLGHTGAEFEFEDKIPDPFEKHIKLRVLSPGIPK